MVSCFVNQIVKFKNKKKMKTYFKTVNEILENEKECPFPISVIPNNMGINLCSVDAISWQKQEDGQLTSLTVHFLPNEVDKLKLSIEQAGIEAVKMSENMDANQQAYFIAGFQECVKLQQRS